MTKHTHSGALLIALCALLCAGCIQPGENSASDGSYLIELTESQTAALNHLSVIIESQNGAINAFNDHDYAACQIWCMQTTMQNDEYASLVEVHAGRVMNVSNASLSTFDREYYEAQLDLLQAFQRNINQSTFDLNLACGYSVAGDDVYSQHHVTRVGECIGAFHNNIDRFNDNIDAHSKESDNFAAPVPDPSDWVNPPDVEDAADNTDAANTTLSGRAGLSEIPDPYYLDKANFQNTPDEVQRLLGKGFFTSYACSSFDCSEMAAYIEWKLECHNVTAQIATKDNWEGIYGHAWVIVPLRGENNLAIEPTISAMEGSLGAEMITYDPQYFVCDHLFNDIYEASEFFGIEEWDWWNKLELI
ncbi:MAG: hypothetical protein EF813_12300 [Methanosarcinales archaeon]|nr:MAG: hypothetical protein EF813_12300 [Methanosarcinales archaeon]